jgi:hypothetical protein
LYQQGEVVSNALLESSLAMIEQLALHVRPTSLRKVSTVVPAKQDFSPVCRLRQK